MTKITHRKILDARYWWPMLYRDVHDYFRSCDACQRTRGLAIQSFVNTTKKLCIFDPLLSQVYSQNLPKTSRA